MRGKGSVLLAMHFDEEQGARDRDCCAVQRQKNWREAGRARLNQKSALPGVRGNGMTSRMFFKPVRYIIIRSRPRPKPECGTEP